MAHSPRHPSPSGTASRRVPAKKPASPRPAPATDSINLIHYLLNHIGDEIMLIDSQARIVFVNDATVKGIGLPREVILNHRVTDFMTEKMGYKKWRKRYFQALRKQRSAQTFRIQRISGQGERQTLDVTVAYMPYRTEEYLLSVGRDVTHDLAMQNRLKESQDLYQLISEGAGDGIFTCDLNGVLTYVNPAMERLISLPAASLKNHQLMDFIHKGSIAKVQGCFRRALQGEQNLREDIDLVSVHQERVPVEISMAPLRKGDRIVSVHAMVRDSRNRRHLEAIMRQSEKMQAIQVFIAGMAKEIRDPLFSVMALTRRLTERYQHRDFEYIGYSEFSEMMKALGQIHARASYSHHTVERLLTLIKRKSGLQRDRCYPLEVVRGVFRLRSSQLKMNNIQFKIFASAKLPQVAIGKVELTQVLENLLNNSIPAMPAGGKITARLKYLRPQSRVQIILTDTGVGIAPEDLPHAFEPFFTTHQYGPEKRSGLGLPIVYEILRAAQGEVNLKSSLRHGTQATIFLPIAH